MRLWNSNVIAVSLGAAVIATFSLLFYFDVTRRVQVGDAEIVGSITYKKKLAQRKYSNQVVWEEVEQNAPVYNYDAIRTAEGAEAVVRIKDGTQFTINENSLVVVAIAKNAIDIEFGAGSITANRNAVTDGKLQTVNIKTAGTTISIGKSDVNVSSEKGKGVNLSVQKGSAIVKTDTSEKQVSAFQNASVAAGKNVEVNTQRFRLLEPGHDSFQLTTGAAKTVAFSWEPVKDARAVYLEVSDSRNFTRTLLSEKLARNRGAASLKEGTYYWRIRAAGRAKGQADTSEVRKFVVLRDDPLLLISPRQGERVLYLKKPPLIQFKWRPSTLASGYELLIARDAEMKQDLRRLSVSSPSITIDNLTKGAYFWRINALSGLGSGGAVNASQVSRFTVDVTGTLDSPEPLYPQDGFVIGRQVLKNSSVSFSWKKNPELTKSVFSVATDKAFKNTVFSANPASDLFSFKSDLSPGTYYWRVAGALGETAKTAPSAARSFIVVEKAEVQLIAPDDRQSVASAIEDKDPSVNFVWKRADIPGLYHLEVAKDDRFSQPVDEATTREFHALSRPLPPGKYHWRVSLLNKEGAVLMTSQSRSVELVEGLGTPLMLSPRNDEKVNMRSSSSLALRWQRVKGADQYEVTLYQIKGRGQQKIVSALVADTVYEMKELKRLDEGKFSWTLQAIDLEKGKILRKSPTTRARFDITLGGPLQKPLIDLPKVLYLEFRK